MRKLKKLSYANLIPQNWFFFNYAFRMSFQVVNWSIFTVNAVSHKQTLILQQQKNSVYMCIASAVIFTTFYIVFANTFIKKWWKSFHHNEILKNNVWRRSHFLWIWFLSTNNNCSNFWKKRTAKWKYKTVI